MIVGRVVIPFPSEPEALYKQARAERRLTAQQRILAVADLVTAGETLARAGGVYEAQRQYQQRLEDEWRRCMREFIQQHVAS